MFTMNNLFHVIIFILAVNFRQFTSSEVELIGAQLTTGTSMTAQLKTICGTTNTFQKRIVGGADAELNEYPWMAAIFRDQDFSQVSCGGVLINQNFILTVLHCLLKEDSKQIKQPEDFTIRLGVLDIFSTADGAKPENFTVKRLIPHENYSINTQANDIALIELSESVNFSQSMLPVCLPESPDFISSTYDNKRPFIIGWGALEYDGHSSSKLQQVRVDVIPISKCREEYPDLPDKDICAGFQKGGKDACQGDSGGPLMIPGSNNQMTVIGLVSDGYQCAEPGHAGIYTRVASHIPWIKTNAGMV